jgi:TorA maturation chaperone TorD
MLTGAVIVGEARASADVYGFLATVLSSHPTLESVTVLRRLAAEMELPCPGPVAMAELDREYMELFVVPNPRYVAPYESVFRDRWRLPGTLQPRSNLAEAGEPIKGLLMGESTLDVRQTYARAGILPDDDLPDHIGNELRFIAYTWAAEATAGPEDAVAWAEVRERFRREHVLQWIGLLREKVAERERLGYYGAALRMAEALLQEDDAR